MDPPGVEPGSGVYKTPVLTVELRVQIRLNQFSLRSPDIFASQKKSGAVPLPPNIIGEPRSLKMSGSWDSAGIILA